MDSIKMKGDDKGRSFTKKIAFWKTEDLDFRWLSSQEKLFYMIFHRRIWVPDIAVVYMKTNNLFWSVSCVNRTSQQEPQYSASKEDTDVCLCIDKRQHVQFFVFLTSTLAGVTFSCNLVLRGEQGSVGAFQSNFPVQLIRKK